MTDETEKPNRRALAKASTYQKILEAAAGLFAAEGGYEAATTRSIAKAAGMSTGAVFAHFPDKATLYRAIYGHAPISPEQGRSLAILVAQFQDQARPEAPDTTAAEELACKLLERAPCA